MFDPESQVGDIDFHGIHNSVDVALGRTIVAHLAFTSVVEIDWIKNVLVADCAGSIRRGLQLLQNNECVGVDGISPRTGWRYVVLAAKSPTQPILRDSNPVPGGSDRDRRVGV